MTTGNYLANITLPLALICTGASIDFKILFKTSDVSLWASLGRVIVAPIFMVGIGKLFGLSEMGLGIIFSYHNSLWQLPLTPWFVAWAVMR